MSRNKFILLFVILAALYYTLPNTGVYHTIKVNTVASLPYLMLCFIAYLLITITLLKRAWKRLDNQPTDEHTVAFAKIMNLSFDVVRILGEPNLIALYNKINFTKSVSTHAKQLLYTALRRKRLDVSPPGQAPARTGKRQKA
jgi:hypothetical protein